MPRRKLHDEEQDDEITTVGQNDDLGPLDDYDEDGFPSSEYSARRLFDDPEDDEEEYHEDEEEYYEDEEEYYGDEEEELYEEE
jgi:hypothetical protein